MESKKPRGDAEEHVIGQQQIRKLRDNAIHECVDGPLLYFMYDEACLHFYGYRSEYFSQVVRKLRTVFVGD